MKNVLLRLRGLAIPVAFLLPASPAYAYQLNHVSVHDPSVVWEPTGKYYYIFGSHHGAARSKDMMSWQATNWSWGSMKADGTVATGIGNDAAFKTCATKTVTKGGAEVEFPQFNAHDWSAAYGNYSIAGNMWAPDVIFNEKMQKWCMYMSINGPTWNSSIVLLTADKITGPYVYQGPVVISGFNVNSTVASLNYKNTDLELAIGTQASLPARYNVGNNWGRRWPHCIDPCVFYDEEGRLWMSYGSWSGGIWMLELDEENGLRDYDVVYPSTGGTTDGVTSDPYFGKKIAGGFYSSGEGSYIEHIGDYYYLFISNGGLAAGGKAGDYNNGGYQMRVFRSRNPNGTYVDSNGKSAVLTAYELNFGPDARVNRGVNIFGAYGYWGDALKANGERSQGHNSIIDAPDGRTYLVYHTRFQNNGEMHQVRVHQVFQNEDGWLVAAPFEYTGETVTSADIATTQQVRASQIVGTYKLLIHKYGLDHRKKEMVSPVDITLHADGTISGDRTGQWTRKSGTCYVNLTIAGVQYKGVMVEQTIEPSQTKRVPSFTALAKTGVTVWGYRTGDDVSAIDDVTRETVNGESADSQCYDLQGRKIANSKSSNRKLPKGMYIRNRRIYMQ